MPGPADLIAALLGQSKQVGPPAPPGYGQGPLDRAFQPLDVSRFQQQPNQAAQVLQRNPGADAIRKGAARGRENPKYEQPGTFQSAVNQAKRLSGIGDLGPDEDSLFHSAVWIRAQVPGANGKYVTASPEMDSVEPGKARFSPDAAREVAKLMRTPEGREQLRQQVEDFKAKRSAHEQSVRDARAGINFSRSDLEDAVSKGLTVVRTSDGKSIPLTDAMRQWSAAGMGNTVEATPETDEQQVMRQADAPSGPIGWDAAGDRQRNQTAETAWKNIQSGLNVPGHVGMALAGPAYGDALNAAKAENEQRLGRAMTPQEEREMVRGAMGTATLPGMVAMTAGAALAGGWAHAADQFSNLYLPMFDALVQSGNPDPAHRDEAVGSLLFQVAMAAAAHGLTKVGDAVKAPANMLQRSRTALVDLAKAKPEYAGAVDNAVTKIDDTLSSATPEEVAKVSQADSQPDIPDWSELQDRSFSENGQKIGWGRLSIKTDAIEVSATGTNAGAAKHRVDLSPKQKAELRVISGIDSTGGQKRALAQWMDAPEQTGLRQQIASFLDGPDISTHKGLVGKNQYGQDVEIIGPHPDDPAKTLLVRNLETGKEGPLEKQSFQVDIGQTATQPTNLPDAQAMRQPVDSGLPVGGQPETVARGVAPGVLDAQGAGETPVQAGGRAQGDSAGAVKEPWQMTRDEYSALRAPDADTKKVLARAEKVAGILQDLGWDLERGAQIPRSSWAEIAKKAGVKNLYEFSLPDAQGLKVIDLGNGYVGIKRAGTQAEAWHYFEIEQALRDGKPVPPEVLADYPDLAKKYGALTNETTQEANAVREVAQGQGLQSEGGLAQGQKAGQEADAVLPQEEGQVGTPAQENRTVGDPDLTGYAKQVTGRDAMAGTTPQAVLEAGRAAMAEGKVDPVAAVKRVLSGGPKLDPTEIGATIDHLNGLRNQADEIAKAIAQTDDPLVLASLNKDLDAITAQAEEFQIAGDITGNEWHKVGQALQIALKPDYSMASLMARAKASLMGTAEGIPEAVKAKLTDLSNQLQAANAKMDEMRATFAAKLREGRTSTYSGPARERGIRAVKAYFGAAGGQAETFGGMASKRSGAARYTIPKEGADAMRGVRSLAKEAAVNGAESLDDVLDYVRREAGIEASDDQLLRLLSDDYRSHMVEADVTKRKADRYLRDLQAAAAFKLKTPLQKTLAVVGDIFTSTQRGMRAGLDLSAPFIQGRKALNVRDAGEWVRAWKPMLEAAWRGDQRALEHLADVAGDPMYSRSVAAGLQLTEPGGRFTSQEEMFAGNFTRQFGEKIPVLKTYFKALEHSDAAFATFLNKLRYDVWKKLASVSPEDPAYMRDVADQVNIIFGRGTGKLADAAGRAPLVGNVVNAPRFSVSQWQYPFMSLMAKTEAGRKAALKQQAAMALSYMSVAALAKMAGWNVNLDYRSTNVGKAVGPDGQVWDIWGKDAQPVRLFAQLALGKFNQAGDYRPPNAYNSGQVAVQYLKGKAQPGVQLAIDSVFGRYDPETGKQVDMTPADYALAFTPYHVEQIIRDKSYQTAPLQIPAGIVGQDASPPNPRINPNYTPHPLELPRRSGNTDGKKKGRSSDRSSGRSN